MKSATSLTVKDLLKRPLFLEAKLVAGKKGIERKIDWVHIIDIPAVAPFTNQNNLILTTGLGFRQKAMDQKKYILGLIEQGASGLCVELSEHLHELPREMSEIANQYNFPILLFPQPIRFVDITQDIHSLLINQKYQILMDLESFLHKLQQLTLQSTDVMPVLQHLHDYTALQVVYYSLLGKDHFYPPVSPDIAQDLGKQFKIRLEKLPSGNQEPLILEVNPSKFGYFQPVNCLGQTVAYVGVILHKKTAAESGHLERFLDYVSKGAATILLREMYLLEKTIENHNDLINDILESKITNEEQASAKIGLPPLKNGCYLYIAGIFDIKHNVLKNKYVETESKNQDILVLLRSILKKNGMHSLLKIRNNQIYLLCIKEAFSEASDFQSIKKIIQKTVEQLQQYIDSTLKGKIRLAIGFGDIKRKISDAAQSFKEASDTLEMARQLPYKISPFYEELGIFQLIKWIPGKQMLYSFIKQHLGKVLLYDMENNSNLLDTLDMYLKCMGAKQMTAEKLYIHRQTLYHRLEKLEDLLGEDFLQPDKRICLELALRALDTLPAEFTQNP